MSNELVKVTVTPQGTADVYIGDLHIKTFGGKVAHQAACDFAQQIKNELSKPTETRERRQSIPRISDIERTVDRVGETFQVKFTPTDEVIGDSADDYKLETRSRR